MVSAKKSFLKRLLITIITVILVFSALSLAATKIIYDNIFTRYDSSDTISEKVPVELLDSRQQFRYKSGENLLSGYLYPAENSKTLVVLAPGYRAAAESYIWQIKSLTDYGWSVFAFDPTGSCESEGDSAIGFPQELCDLEATLKFINDNNSFDYQNVAILGHSRGGYAACCALSFNYDISAVITVSGVNSAMEGVMGHSEEYVGPLAYGNYGFLWLYQTMLFGAETVNLNADEEISNTDVPVLVIHGDNDTQVPMDKYSIISHRDEIKSDFVEYSVYSKDGQDGHTDILFDADGTANRKLMAEINDFLAKSISG